jgi:arylsulfatase A-like enzyme
LNTDGHVGQLLKKLDDLGIANNTIVVYTTDNGAEVMTWPDGGQTPFRGEKATNWEGGFRVPMVIRWPGVITPGTIINDLCAHEDLLPTFAAAAGEPDVVAKALKGYLAGGKTFKVHLDGYNLIPFFKGEIKESPRRDFLYWNDDGQLTAIRVQHLKVVFLEQRSTGFGVWREAFTPLRMPKTFNLRSDPFERGDESTYPLETSKLFFVVPAQAVVAQWLETFKQFPPRQKPASFNLDEVMAKLTAPQGSGK